MRPRELKKLEHEARCTLLDEERIAFADLVGFIVDLIPLAGEARTDHYVRIRLRQPETEPRLHRLLASIFRVPTVHFPDLALQVEHKENVHACYRIWCGQVPTRARIKTTKASGTRSEASGGMWLWAQGWGPAVACIHRALAGPVDAQVIVFRHLHEDTWYIL